VRDAAAAPLEVRSDPLICSFLVDAAPFLPFVGRQQRSARCVDRRLHGRTLRRSRRVRRIGL